MKIGKKILLGLFCVCLCAVCAFSLVGCKKIVYSKTTTADNASYNGGSSLIYNGYLYFVNGQLENNGKNNGKKSMGSIYRVKIGADGKLADNPRYEKVVDSLVGFKNGSIRIIGDFLYYATPSSGKDKKGNILYNKTKFMRYDLIKKATQELYTTSLNSDSEEVDYAYYTVGSSDVYLLVYEKSNSSLTSVKVGQDPYVVFKKSDVTSAVFSENLGKDKFAGTSSHADNFIFYTTAVTSSDKEQRGNKVYMISPNGNGGKQISQGIDISLLCIRGGKLLYTAKFNSNTYVYASSITADSTMGALAVSSDPNYATPNADGITKLVSYSDYEQIVFLEEQDADSGEVKIAVLCYDDKAKMIRYFAYENGIMQEDKNRQVYTFTSSATVKFIQTYTEKTTEGDKQVTRDYIIYTNGSLVYKLRYNSSLEAEQVDNSSRPVQLSTTKVEDANGLMAGKVIGEYIYVFAKDGDSNILLHRINFYTPKEQAERNEDTEQPGDGETGEGTTPSEGEDSETEDDEKDKLEIGKAELIGGKNI